MKFIYTFIFLLLIHLSTFAQYIPATEIRAVWLTTNWGLDWPEIGASTYSQKDDLRRQLDELKKNNFNTVFFQVRAQGQVFYNSRIEPKSSYYDHYDGFDPLAFAIEECHKRGLECHAWLVTYPGSTSKKIATNAKGKKATRSEWKPDYYKLIDGKWYLDPGHPETNKLILSIVREIVTNYNVDGIHFDYIRYPNSDRKFPDQDTYRKYSDGESLYEWRRQNINRLMGDIYDTTKSIKKWVQVSSSPLGRYRPIWEIDPDIGWTAYETVFQDAVQWMKEGKQDAVYPMLYYKDQDFYPYLNDWVKNSNGRIVVPGLGVYQLLSDQQDWGLSAIMDQMNYTRRAGIKGQAYFRAGILLDNVKGVNDALKEFYPYPAKLPALTWLDNKAPMPPTELEIYKDEKGNLQIKWETPEDESDVTYTVYASVDEEIDTDSPLGIMETAIRGNAYSFEASEGDYGFYYTVTASDRYHNESAQCVSVYFSHSDNEQ